MYNGSLKNKCFIQYIHYFILPVFLMLACLFIYFTVVFCQLLRTLMQYTYIISIVAVVMFLLINVHIPSEEHVHSRTHTFTGGGSEANSTHSY